MARKATDLLDVFRAEHPAPARGGAKSKEGSTPAKRGFAGMVLLPRQLLLGSAVVLLLLVFTFVLGLKVGSRDGSDPQTLAGARSGGSLSAVNTRDTQTKYTYVEARVPYMDPARHVANDPAILRASLVRTRGVPPELIWITDDITAQRLRVLLGPFTNSEKGVEFLRRYGLLTFKLGGVLPWKNPDYPVYASSDLPLNRLPLR